MAEDNRFNITINNFEGYSPAYFTNSWSYVGNKGSANSMTDIDCSDPNIITQGGGSTPLTNGTQTGSITTLVSSILKTPTSSGVSWATGGDKIYKISSTTVINTGGYPMSIDKGSVTGETSTSLLYYKSNLYVFYNHSGSLGDIAKLTIATDTLDADWGCYSEDTEVLTSNGWKKFGEVKVGEKIPSLNIKTGKVEETINTQTLVRPFNGEMINFKSRSCDLLVTTDHNMVASINAGANNWKPYQIIKAKDIENKKSKLIKTADWSGKFINYWKIPAIETKQEIIERDKLGRIKKSKGKKYKKEELKIPIKTFLTFLGFYLSEGCCSKNGTSINIAQMRKSKGWNKIKECLDELKLLGLNYSIDERRGFTIYSKQLCNYIKSFVPGYSYEKYIPREILKLDKSLLFNLYEAMMLGDGNYSNGVLCQYSTSSPKLKNTFEELINILGWSPTTNIKNNIGRKIIGDRIVKRLGYQISINRKQIYQTFNNNPFGAKPKRQQYIGNIVCLVLDKNHTMLVRRNGKQVWCGNSTVPTGASALISSPHYAILGGDDKMAFTNGNYLGTYNGTTLNTMALDFFSDSQAISVTYGDNRYIVGVNRPNISGSNFNQSAIYKWDGTSPSWDGDPVEVNGEIGALFTKNGVTYVWWKDGVGTGGCNFGYVNGTQLTLIRRYDGSLPNQEQVGEYYGFIMWLSGAKLMMWGSGDTNLSVNMFHYLTSQYATTGALGYPFGEILIASTGAATPTNFSLCKESGYSLLSEWKSVSFDLSGIGTGAIIDKIKIVTETIGTGGKCVPTLYYNDNASSKVLETLVAGKTRHLCLMSGIMCNNFKIGLNWSTGSATNPVKIRAIYIGGTIVTEQ
jgi:hypothetical protein